MLVSYSKDQPGFEKTKGTVQRAPRSGNKINQRKGKIKFHTYQNLFPRTEANSILII